MKKIVVFVFSFILTVVSFSKDLKKNKEVSIPIFVKTEVVELHKVDEDIKILENKILSKDKKLKVMAINKEKITNKKNQLLIKKNDLNKKFIEVDVKL